MYDFYVTTVARLGMYANLELAKQFTPAANCSNRRLKRFFLAKFFKGGRAEAPYCVTSKLDELYPNSGSGKIKPMPRWEADIQNGMLARYNFLKIVPTFTQMRPEKCNGCKCLRPDAVCDFFSMTADLTFPVVMTKNERRRYFTDKVRASKPNHSCRFLRAPECLLSAIEEYIVVREDLTEAGGENGATEFGADVKQA